MGQGSCNECESADPAAPSIGPSSALFGATSLELPREVQTTPAQSIGLPWTVVVVGSVLYFLFSLFWCCFVLLSIGVVNYRT